MRVALPPTIDAAAFAAHHPSAAVFDLHGETMGTSWSVRFAAPAGAAGADPSLIRSAIVARLARLVAEMSHWAKDSLLCRFNRSAPDTWTTLPPDFAHVMTRGLAIADAWGFGPVPIACPPSTAEIETARATSGWSQLSFAPGGAHLR